MLGAVAGLRQRLQRCRWVLPFFKIASQIALSAIFIVAGLHQAGHNRTDLAMMPPCPPECLPRQRVVVALGQRVHPTGPSRAAALAAPSQVPRNAVKSCCGPLL